jgi:nickel-dependent lactate racemase
MQLQTVRVKRQKWFEDDEMELGFPASWDIVQCRMNGHDAAALTSEQIRDAILNPTGCPRLRDTAQGKSQVAIVFDDISRPTEVSEIVPFLLDELHEAGIPDSAIRFICALGTHGAHTYEDFRKKLGSAILDRFPVFNHNPYENCSYVGRTSNGVDLFINSELMSCDLKIAIGSIIPHANGGYGGGGKIILPGVAHVDSIVDFHIMATKARESGKADTVGFGKYTENPLVHAFNEAAEMIGLDFLVNALVNASGETCGLFAGKTLEAYHNGVKAAQTHYATNRIEDADIIVINNYGKVNEAIIGLILGLQMLTEKRSDLVLIMDCPAGQVVHYLMSSFGKCAQGRLFGTFDMRVPALRRLVIVCPQFEKSFNEWILTPDGSIWVKTWPEAMDVLMQDYPDGAKAAIVPDGTIQYLV